MTYFSRRLPAVLPRKDLVALLAPTYAAERAVDLDEASERLGRALAAPPALDDLYRGLSVALRDVQGPRTDEDVLMDRLSAGVEPGASARRPRRGRRPSRPRWCGSISSSGSPPSR